VIRVCRSFSKSLLVVQFRHRLLQTLEYNNAGPSFSDKADFFRVSLGLRSQPDAHSKADYAMLKMSLRNMALRAVFTQHNCEFHAYLPCPSRGGI